MNGRDLYQLLPAAIRTRDVELVAGLGGLLTAAEEAELLALRALAAPTPAERARLDVLNERLAYGPLRSLLDVLAEPLEALDANLTQLYDDLFVETAAEWVMPYIGDLIGYRVLHGDAVAGRRRAEVAHTIAFRRRKGTASMLEQLARDVTGWRAHVVEAFQLLAHTQYMNHVRVERPATADIRRTLAAERAGTAFDAFAHNIDVRRIENGRGRFNIPNIAIFLWPFDALSQTAAPPAAVDTQRFHIHPLGFPAPLVTRTEPEDDIAQLADLVNVPAPITRRVLLERLGDYYGEQRSIAVHRAGALVASDDVLVRHLGDNGPTWGLTPVPAGACAIDPVLGRVMLGTPLAGSETLTVTSHYASTMAIGGGEYARGPSVDPPGTQIERVSSTGLAGHHATIQAALAALAAIGQGGVVEIVDSGRYEASAANAIAMVVPAARHIEIRASGGRRPVVIVESPIVITGGADATATVTGLLVAGVQGQVLVDGGGNPLPGELIQVPDGGGNALVRLTIAHTTVVPGRSRSIRRTAEHPQVPGVVVARDSMQLVLEHAITGSLRVHPTTETRLRSTIVDATSPNGTAYSAPDGVSAGGALHAERCTFVGAVLTEQVDLLSNSISLSRVVASRRQHGCVRFSYLPLTSRVPRRHRCQPHDAAPDATAPRFASLEFGSPLYLWLVPAAAPEIRRGAEDEGEMGAMHDLLRPLREANLRIRLDEYLRAGLEAGVFYETHGLDPLG